MVTFTLTFSHVQDGIRIPLYENGQEVTLTVESDSKTATYSNQEAINFCTNKGNDCRIRGVR